MFAAEHTDLDLETFLVLDKRLIVVALRLVHVPDITITCSNVLVVVARPPRACASPREAAR